jgi:hypothetical protein
MAIGNLERGIRTKPELANPTRRDFLGSGTFLGVAAVLVGIPAALAVYQSGYSSVEEVDPALYDSLTVREAGKEFQRLSNEYSKSPNIEKLVEISDFYISPPVGHVPRQNSVYERLTADQEQTIFRNDFRLCLESPDSTKEDRSVFEFHFVSDKNEELFKKVDTLLATLPYRTDNPFQSRQYDRKMIMRGIIKPNSHFPCAGHSIAIEDDNGIMQVYPLSDLHLK